MIKKWNAVCSWVITLFLLGHLLTMSYSMLTGWYNYAVCKTLARGTAAAVVIHIILCIVSFYSMRGAVRIKKYQRENWRLIAQRVSGIIILIFLYPHMRAFCFIVNETALSGGAKFILLVTEILFLGAVFLHLGVSFSRSMLTLGLLRDDKMEKTVDCAAGIICGILMVLTTVALIRFVILW